MSAGSRRGVIDTLRFSTRAFDPTERFARYSDFYSNGSDSVALGSSVSAEIEAWRLDGLILFERRLAGLGAERLAPRVRRNQFDHFTLQLNVAGEFHGEGARGFQAVRPGEILLLDMAKPMRIRMPDAHLLTLVVPRAVLESIGAAVDELHGLVVPAELSATLSAFLLSRLAPADAAAVSSPRRGGELLAELLGPPLSKMGLAKSGAREPTTDARLYIAQSFIRAHLFDEKLSPERVAQAANLSRASLYRLFEESGGVRKYVQTQRLAFLRRRLSNPSELETVAALAYDAGFVSEHHASRSFKQTFGLPPAEFRREIRLSAQSIYGDHASELKRKLLEWYSSPRAAFSV
jgi:AraC-like DNA-binding protein